MLNINPILNFVHHLRLFYGNGYYSYLIMVGLGLGETLKQEGATYGPRATSGPQRLHF